jgi:hypothetical protein
MEVWCLQHKYVLQPQFANMRTTEIYDDTAITAVRVVRFRDNIDQSRSRVRFVCCRQELQMQARQPQKEQINCAKNRLKGLAKCSNEEATVSTV